MWVVVVVAVAAALLAQAPECEPVNPYVVACEARLVGTTPQEVVATVAGCIAELDPTLPLDREGTLTARWYVVRTFISPLPFKVLGAMDNERQRVYVLEGAPQWVVEHEVVHLLVAQPHGQSSRLTRAAALCTSEPKAGG